MAAPRVRSLELALATTADPGNQLRNRPTSDQSPRQMEVGNRHDLLQQECGRMLALPSLNHVQLRACSASRFCQSSIKICRERCYHWPSLGRDVILISVPSPADCVLCTPWASDNRTTAQPTHQSGRTVNQCGEPQLCPPICRCAGHTNARHDGRDRCVPPQLFTYMRKYWFV